LILDFIWHDQQFCECKAHKIPTLQTKSITSYTAKLLATLSHSINTYMDQKVSLQYLSIKGKI